jgi:hypothetical protein
VQFCFSLHPHSYIWLIQELNSEIRDLIEVENRNRLRVDGDVCIWMMSMDLWHRNLRNAIDCCEPVCDQVHGNIERVYSWSEDARAMLYRRGSKCKMIHSWVRELNAEEGERRVVDAFLRNLGHGNIHTVRSHWLASIRIAKGAERILQA